MGARTHGASSRADMAAEQARLLELIATGVERDLCLRALCASAATLTPGVRAGVTLANDSRSAVALAVAPGLERLAEALVGLPIDERLVGTCGTAIHEGRVVASVDIENDADWWPEWRALCVAEGVRACISTPVIVDGAALASFILCFPVPRKATPRERRLGAFGAHLAAIALKRDSAERALRESERRLAAMVQQATAGLAECDASGRFLMANARFCEIVGHREEALIKLRMQDITHPDDLDAEILLLDRIASGGPDSIVEQRIVRGDGTEAWVSTSIGAVRDVTGTVRSLLAVCFDISERRRAEAALRDSEERLRLALSAGELGVWSWDPATDTLAWDEAQCAIYGVDPESFRPSNPAFWALVHPDDLPALQLAALASQLEDRPLAAEFRIRRSDGALRWVAIRAITTKGADGAPRMLVGVTRDVTDRRIAEEQRKLIVGELDHRMKNLLAIVQAVATQTFRRGEIDQQTRDAFDARLTALAQAHAVLTRESWDEASLADVVAGALAAHRGAARFTITGPPVQVSGRLALALALAFHELATNAAKYGALSGGAGLVTLAWRVIAHDDSRSLQIDWLETGGPPVEPPRRTGFGMRLIRRGLPEDVIVDLRFESSGVQCRIKAPL